MQVKKPIALITGATRGIGKAIALALGQSGMTIAGTATTQGGADQITTFLKDQGINGKGFELNVADHDAIEKIYANIAESFGPPLVLVNNAAITADNILLRMKDSEWNSIIETNLNSVFHLSKSCLKNMVKARWGRIISISSIVGVTGNAGQANYAAAKAGIIGFSKSLAQEIASRNVTVNVIAPGFIDTNMTRSLSEEQRAHLLKKIPMGRLGQPEDIAEAVAFLASEKGGYITGQTLHVNGGMYMN